MTSLTTAYDRLNDFQREAVDLDGDTVVLAGPGSGKTDTLAVKACLLLRDHVPAPRGVACITYTRAAAREISNRAGAVGGGNNDRLFAGTVHAFCMRKVLMPFAHLVGEPELHRPTLCTAAQAQGLLQEAFDQVGVNENPQYWTARLQVIRRAQVAGEDLESRFDERDIAAVDAYQALLTVNGVVDYDAIVHHAVRFVEQYPRVADLLASAYPWLLVDEYQDLGAALHRLVLELRSRASIRVFAVGDPDQTIMQFTGADPRYLAELEVAGFHPVRLRRNYRSGLQLIRAAAGALGVDRSYEPDPDNRDDGRLEAPQIPGGIMAQASYVAGELLPSIINRGTAPEEIAVLYPEKGRALDALRQSLDATDVDYSFERDARFESFEPVAEWLQRCARYALQRPGIDQVRFRTLSDELRLYLADAGRVAGSTRLAAAVALQEAIDAAGSSADAPLAEWLDGLMSSLELIEVLKAGGVYGAELDAIADLVSAANVRGPSPTLGDFAGVARQADHVVVTTYHSSKGRQFDVVVLPFLQQGFMPRARKIRSQWKLQDVPADRLLFYVALTRARSEAWLIHSAGSGVDKYGDAASWPPSQFVTEVAAALRSG